MQMCYWGRKHGRDRRVLESPMQDPVQSQRQREVAHQKFLLTQTIDVARHACPKIAPHHLRDIASAIATEVTPEMLLEQGV